MAVLVQKASMIEVDCIHPNEWNPNQQTDDTFNQLVEEIKEDGFDHPLNIVPFEDHPDHTDDTPQWKIIGGEHRWKAAQVLGMKKVPAIIHYDWDEVQQKLKTVRRNLLSGELNSKKFTALVHSLGDNVDSDSMHSLFGFDDRNEFDKYVIRDKDAKEKTFLDGLLEEARRDKYAVDSLSDIISTIFAECAETIDQNYLFFTYKGAMVAVVLCDDACSKSVKRLVDHLKDTGEDVSKFMSEAIDSSLDKISS